MSYSILAAFLLTACAASVSSITPEPLEVVRDLAFMEPAVDIPLTESGSTYVAKFSSTSAINSMRTFVADYHGELRITLRKSREIECHFWAEGRITDPLIYDGVNGFIEAYSTLCAGKLQRDGSFEFQGAYSVDVPEGVSQEEDVPTFTLKGKLKGEVLDGDVLLGGVFRNDVSLQDTDTLLLDESGVAYEAVEVR